MIRGYLDWLKKKGYRLTDTFDVYACYIVRKGITVRHSIYYDGDLKDER